MMRATLRAVVAKLLSLVLRGRRDRELAAELESHLQLHVDDNLRAGMTPAEARRHALLKLGGVAQVEEECRRARGIPLLEHLLRDVRFGARTLTAAPGFTAVAILTLAAGIGVNAAIFSVLNAVLFRPLPVERPSEVVMLNRNGGVPTHSYPDYRDFRDRNSVLSGLAAYRFAPMSLDGGGAPVRIWGYLATANYFEVLGVRTVLGRPFTAFDDRAPGEYRVAVLSHACWQRRFGASPDIAGKTIRINGEAFTILGVAPPGFRGTELIFTPELWVPMSMQAFIEAGNDWLERRGTHNIFLVGRLRPEITRIQAEASLQAIAAQLGREHPGLNEGLTVSLSPPGLAGSFLRGPVIGFSGGLLAIAGLVLLLACTNLTGLMLARTTDGRRDRAIRLAVGAARRDLVRQALVESAMISLAGMTVGLVLAYWIAAVFANSRLPVDFPLTLGIDLDFRVIAFSVALALLTVLLVGLVPALHGARTEVVTALKEETPRNRVGWEVRDFISGAQMAVSTILLIASLLVVQSLRQAAHVDLGFKPDGAVSVRVDLGLQGYDAARGREFQRRVLDEISSLPGIESASLANSLPLSLDSSTHTIYIEGKPEPKGVDVPSVPYYQVKPGFFRTMQTRLVAGRDFSRADGREGLRVAIVNQAFAARFFGQESAIGRRVRSGRGAPWIEIVGVVQDGKYHSLAEAPQPVIFHPLQQWYNPTTTIVARTALSEGDALARITEAVHRLDPTLSLFDAGSLRELVALPLFPARVAAVFLGGFGLLALVLVTIGTYGLISYRVARSTRELCIRLALGASWRHILAIVLRRTALIGAAGASTGVAASLAAAPLLSPILQGVAPHLPAAIAIACGILVLVTALACFLPARRALVCDPALLLRRA